MLKDLNEIKKARLKLGLTQTELAEKSGVSQSLITKIENKRIIPSYQKGRDILDALERMLREEGAGLRAGDVHSKELLYMKKSDKIGTALEIMEENAVSQLPVIEDNMVVGALTEKCLIKNFDRLDGDENVERVMGNPFPVFPTDTELSLVKEVLRYHPCILTTQKGKMTGIITKADLLSEI